jgi:hypothetical protein
MAPGSQASPRPATSLLGRSLIGSLGHDGAAAVGGGAIVAPAAIRRASSGADGRISLIEPVPDASHVGGGATDSLELGCH